MRSSHNDTMVAPTITPSDIERAEKFRRGIGGSYDRDVDRLAAEFARHRHQSGRTGAGEALPKWVYDIQWGPEGQQDYAHVYDLGGNLIAVMKTHDAARIAKHRGCGQ